VRDSLELTRLRQPGLFDELLEEWRPVAGWEGFYEVSSLGRVRRLDTIVGHSVPGGVSRRSGRILRQGKNHGGYHRVTLCRNNIPSSHAVAPLVCIAFHGPNPGGKEVAHNNGRKDDNRAVNLAWKTHAENEADKRLHGTLAVGVRNGQHTRPGRTARGEAHGCAKLTSEQVATIRRIHATGHMGCHRLAKMFSVANTTIKDIVNRRIWTHLG